jgi:hypothetical protein
LSALFTCFFIYKYVVIGIFVEETAHDNSVFNNTCTYSG